MAVGMAVAHINAGRVEEALQLLDGAIEASTVPNMGALVARGTARALKRDLTGMRFQFCLHTGGVKCVAFQLSGGLAEAK